MKTLLAWVVVGLAVVGGACTGGDSKAGREGRAPQPTATLEPSEGQPETLLGLPVRTLKEADAAPLPEDVALLIESGCWGCDGPAAALERWYRDPSGIVRTEDMFRLPGATAQRPEIGERYITSIAVDGNDILLGLCDGPYCGGVANAAAGAKTSVHHSVDGGVTWDAERTIDGGAFVVDNVAGMPGGIGFGLVRVEAAGELKVLRYPGLEPQPVDLQGQTPAEARFLVPASGPPFVLGSDGVSLYRVGGPTAQYVFSSLPAGATVLDFQFVPRNSTGLVTFTTGDAAYSALVDTNSPPAVTFTAVYRWPGEPPFLHRPQGGFIDGNRWALTVTGTPSVVDLEAETIAPIEEFANRAAGGDRLLVRGVSVGPFARVTVSGTCLNVREAPSLTSPPFACMADGVLLQELGQNADADARRWTFVSAPGGRRGWAASEFLKASGSAPSLGYHPAGTRTGDASFDTIIAALEQRSSVPQSLIAWEQVACEVPPIQGLGGPPECPEGVAGGALLEVITGAACHGYWRSRPPRDEPVQLAIGPESRVYAVVRLDASAYPRADHAIIYTHPERPEFGSAVYLSGGKIVGDSGGCGTSPADWATRGDVVFAPPDS